MSWGQNCPQWRRDLITPQENAMKITFTPSFYRLPIGICGLSLPLVIILTQPFEFQK